ncbi:hypothetical protein H8F21_15060 [Pseudomonas sp. P66]|uniref:Uncharacterized protein n=1 Tax=Pseudomonas arcuscaelestis TaxID=2710591 RepID=A0ABS2C1E2_9PSED|nr:hypothetical protein [Pseudomonas arcuscaelestis]MBM5458884.1 hypothetical protein [Pseudomonas arcuscaelestis]
MVDLQPTTRFELVYMRRREFLPLSESHDVDDTLALDVHSGPPVHERSKRWQSQDAFEMRRITKLQSKTGEVIGYRPMIQKGHGSDRERPNKSFRASDFGGSLDEALRQAKLWRDSTEIKLGIKPGRLRSKTVARPWSGVSLIVAKSTGARSYWGSNHVMGSKPLRAYIGKRSYIDAYHDLIKRIAERDGIPLPEELPSPPPPRDDQYRRMTKAGLTGIPEPSRRRKSRSKA